MVEKRAPGESTFYHALSYVHAVKKAFHDDKPEMYHEFMNILRDITAHRVDQASGIAKLEELFKDHQKLLLGLTFFIPKAETNNGFGLSQVEAFYDEPANFEEFMELFDDDTDLRAPGETTFNDAYSYICAVKETFHDDKPEIYHEFLNILRDLTAHRVDKASGIAKARELFKDHRKLLLGLKFFFAKIETTVPPEHSRTIPLEAEHRGGAESINEEKKRAEDFFKNLQTRFKTLDTHVIESVRKIMKEYDDGKISANEMQEEVVSLLYYHEDLIQEFSTLLPKHLWHPKLSQYYLPQ